MSDPQVLWFRVSRIVEELTKARSAHDRWVDVFADRSDAIHYRDTIGKIVLLEAQLDGIGYALDMRRAELIEWHESAMVSMGPREPRSSLAVFVRVKDDLVSEHGDPRTLEFDDDGTLTLQGGNLASEVDMGSATFRLTKWTARPLAAALNRWIGRGGNELGEDDAREIEGDVT